MPNLDIFRFVTQNKDMLAALFLNDENEVKVAPDEFDYSYPDVRLYETGCDSFEIIASVGEFSIVTEISAENCLKHVALLSQIRRPECRRAIVELFEGQYMKEGAEMLMKAEAAKKDAEADLASVTADVDNMKKFLGAVKGAWNIP